MDDYPAIDFAVDFWVKAENKDEVDEGLVYFPDDLGGLMNQHFVLVPLNLGGGKKSPGISIGTNAISLYEMRDGSFQSIIRIKKVLEGWHHVTLTYTDNQPKLYVDGRFYRAGPPSQDTVWAAMEIGHVIAANQPFVGAIDEFRIWNKRLEASDVSEIYDGKDIGKPMLHYDFKNVDDHLWIFDRTGHGHHASVVLAEPLFGIAPKEQPLPYVREFEGTSDFVPGDTSRKLRHYVELFKRGPDGYAIDGWAFVEPGGPNQEVHFHLKSAAHSITVRTKKREHPFLIEKFPQADLNSGYICYIPKDSIMYPPYELTLIVVEDGEYASSLKLPGTPIK